MLIKDIHDKISPPPGVVDHEYIVRKYACSLLEEHILSNGLDIWKDAETLKNLTEEDLLDGSPDWEAYSKGGNALYYTTDLRLRLRDNKSAPEELLLIQAKALKEASGMLLNACRLYCLNHPIAVPAARR